MISNGNKETNAHLLNLLGILATSERGAERLRNIALVQPIMQQCEIGSRDVSNLVNVQIVVGQLLGMYRVGDPLEDNLAYLEPRVTDFKIQLSRSIVGNDEIMASLLYAMGDFSSGLSVFSAQALLGLFAHFAPSE